MEFTKQKHNACMPTAIFMLNDNKDYHKIKTLCRKRFGHSVSKRKGCRIEGHESVIKLLEDLDLKPIRESPANHKFVISATKFNRALILTYTSDEGHSLAWNGYKVYDPDNTIMSDRQFLKYYGHRNISIINLKTPIAHRMINVLKYILYKLGIAE